MYDTVLIPSDGSEHAVRAAEHGVYLARAFDATVHLLNVVDVQAAAGPFDAGGVDKAFVERLESDGRTAIEAVEAVAGEEDRVETALVRGSPAEAILEYGTENGVDLIAMGTHGRTGLERYVAGSVTERVLRLAEVPVLTVRATEKSRHEGAYTDVLVPTDGSEYAARAAGHGIAVAEQVGARVHAVAAADVERLDSIRDFASITGLRERLVADGERWAEAVAARASDAGLDAVTDVREGSPSEVILAYADEHDADLIAMGTRGRTGLDRYLLGSTTERTVRRSDVPVLAVTERE
jgi:nucleotide-binding universal stress UspA family protein